MSVDYLSGCRPYVPATPFRKWVESALPGVYDESLSLYELMAKLLKSFSDVVESVDGMGETSNSLLLAFTALKVAMDKAIADMDVENRVKEALERAGEDGTIEDIVRAVVNELKVHVEVDPTLTKEGEAADAKAVGDRFTEFEEGMGELILNIIKELNTILPVTVINGKASHNHAEIAEAFGAKILPVLIHSTGEGTLAIPLTRVTENLAVFERPTIADGRAIILAATIDNGKNFAVTYEYQNGSGVDTDSVLSIHRSEVGDIRAYGDQSDFGGCVATAFLNHTTVRVPKGTYTCNNPITIPKGCELILETGVHLIFDDSVENCITLEMSASLTGNHSTITVGEMFNGNVIRMDSSTTDSVVDVEPFTQWTPTWKSGRYVRDVNIVKRNADGYHYSADGNAPGNAIYISADGDCESSFMWGITVSGVRIAGAFACGINVVNFNGGWVHEARISDVFIDGCKVGITIKDAKCVYVSASIQPRWWRGADGVQHPFSEHGVKIIRSKCVNLIGTRVWDWDASHTLWAPGNEYQHIALYGDCSGLILDDFLYYTSSYDIRDLIYTDTPANLNAISILQEPIDRWFKNRDGVPYTFDGDRDTQLCTINDLKEHFITDRSAMFTDKLSSAVGTDGQPFGTNGLIRNGTIWDTDGTLKSNAYNGCTGLIPVKQGDVIYADGLSFKDADDVSRVVFFNANFGYVQHVNRANLVAGTSYYAGYEETENGFKVTLLKGLSQAAYVAFNIKTGNIHSRPVIAVNEEVKFTYSGYLSDGIKVKANYIDGLDAAIEAKLGVIENGTY